MKYRLQLQNRWTDDERELVAEVDQIRAAMNAYGLRPIGYDPGVVAVDEQDPNRQSVDLPLWFVRRLMDRLVSPRGVPLALIEVAEKARIAMQGANREHWDALRSALSRLDAQ